MRFPRQFSVLAFLALYAAQIVGGRAVHLWQCSAGAPCTHHATHHHAHDDCHHHAKHGEGKDNDDEPVAPHQHDQSKCQICQILGQAQDKPLELRAVALAQIIEATEVVLAEFYPSLGRSGFRSRAPPFLS